MVAWTSGEGVRPADLKEAGRTGDRTKKVAPEECVSCQCQQVVASQGPLCSSKRMWVRPQALSLP